MKIKAKSTKVPSGLKTNKKIEIKKITITLDKNFIIVVKNWTVNKDKVAVDNWIKSELE